MYHVVGYEITSFTSRQTGDVISGVNVYLGIPIEHGLGYRDVFRKFFSDSVVSNLGGISYIESLYDKDVMVSFDYRGKLLSIDLA